MSTRIRVGCVEIRTDEPVPLDQLVKLLRRCASIAVALGVEEQEPDRAPLGFAAPVLERLPDELPDEP